MINTRMFINMCTIYALERERGGGGEERGGEGRGGRERECVRVCERGGELVSEYGTMSGGENKKFMHAHTHTHTHTQSQSLGV